MPSFSFLFAFSSPLFHLLFQCVFANYRHLLAENAKNAEKNVAHAISSAFGENAAWCVFCDLSVSFCT